MPFGLVWIGLGKTTITQQCSAVCRHCRHCISFWKLQVWPRSCRSYPLQHRWDEKLPKLLIDRKVRLVRKLLQLDSMGTLRLSVRMKWSHGRPDMNFNLCCMLQYSTRVVKLVRVSGCIFNLFSSVVAGEVGCKLCWMTDDDIYINIFQCIKMKHFHIEKCCSLKWSLLFV